MDRLLVERAGRGDEEAFAILARASGDRDGDRLPDPAGRWPGRGRRPGGPAQRLARPANLRDPDRFDAWLRRLLVNASYVEARHERRWSHNIRILPEATGPSGPDEMTSIATRDELDRAFRRVPADQRAVFVYRHYLGFSLNEIATELGLPLGTVKSRLHYATHSLRSALQDGRTTSGTPTSERSA